MHPFGLPPGTWNDPNKTAGQRVDHICLSQSLVAYKLTVGAWESKTASGEKMSDHNGVFVDLQAAAQ